MAKGEWPVSAAKDFVDKAKREQPTPEDRASAAKIARLEEENHRLSKQLGLVESFHAGLGQLPKWLSPPKGKHKPEQATACFQLSDLHLDEVVEPSEVGGLNAYNREVAELRLKLWARKAVELGARYAHKWDGALVYLGGDFVSGAIHEELRETNADVLPGTMVHWAPKLAAALKYVADFYGRVHCPTVVGNHGRLTVKMPFKKRGRNSWDFLLISMVQSLLANDKRITFDISPGSYLFVPVYSRHTFLSHGDEAGGGSGWSGIFTPVMTIHRKGMELASAHDLRISYSVIGHWHSTLLAHARGVSLNGSLKGYDNFASGLRLRPESAAQNFWVESPTRGVTLAAAIFCEDRGAEGW